MGKQPDYVHQAVMKHIIEILKKHKFKPNSRIFNKPFGASGTRFFDCGRKKIIISTYIEGDILKVTRTIDKQIDDPSKNEDLVRLAKKSGVEVQRMSSVSVDTYKNFQLADPDVFDQVGVFFDKGR
jgi:hypothetical protein